MTDNEKLSCLIDRPCAACKFHKEEGCSKWSCVFEEKSDVLGSTDLISREEAQKALYGCVMPNKHAEDIVAEVSSADIMECARAIKEYCKNRLLKLGANCCDSCPFKSNILAFACAISHELPSEWDLPERGNE